MLSLFSIADLIGRLIATYKIESKQLPRLNYLIISFSFLRLAQVYTSLMIGFSEQPRWLFGSDWFKLWNTILLGLGNGFLGTLLMIIGPSKVSAGESERAGQIMAFHMTLGRGLGSMVGVIGFYKVFKEIQEALKNSIMKGKKIIEGGEGASNTAARL